MAEREDLRETLRASVDALSLSVSDLQVDLLFTLAELLEQWSRRMNLTGHRTIGDIVRNLVLDAASLSAELPVLETLVDIGAGAGFPAFPIAILRPECRVTLIESRERRHHFQRQVARRLELANVAILLGRAEALAPSPHTAAIAQGVARPPDALELLLPWTRPGGLVLIPGAMTPPQVPEDRRIDSASVVRYRVVGTQVERTLWMGRRAL